MSKGYVGILFFPIHPQRLFGFGDLGLGSGISVGKKPL